MNKLLYILLFGIFCLSCAPAIAANQPLPVTAGNWNNGGCEPHIYEAERYFGLPTGLLMAIAITESGSAGRPNPLALNVGGQAVYARDYADAAKWLRDGRGQPRKDVAVGCMQIYMEYHGHKFVRPEIALQPRINVWYGAQYLRDLRVQYPNWTLAVAHYHASKYSAQKEYVCRVLYNWRSYDLRMANQETRGLCMAEWKRLSRNRRR